MKNLGFRHWVGGIVSRVKDFGIWVDCVEGLGFRVQGSELEV